MPWIALAVLLTPSSSGANPEGLDRSQASQLDWDLQSACQKLLREHSSSPHGGPTLSGVHSGLRIGADVCPWSA